MTLRDNYNRNQSKLNIVLKEMIEEFDEKYKNSQIIREQKLNSLIDMLKVLSYQKTERFKEILIKNEEELNILRIKLRVYQFKINERQEKIENEASDYILEKIELKCGQKVKELIEIINKHKKEEFEIISVDGSLNE